MQNSFVPPGVSGLPWITCNGRTTAWVHATPALAKQWLELNTKNRLLSRVIVIRMSRDMRNNDWEQTHEGVAFTVDGILADGQKRLTSIVESGRPIDILVTWGLTEKARQAIDRGQVRSTADALAMAGCSIASNRSVAIARRVMLGPRIESGSDKSTDSEVRNFLEAYQASILFALQACQRGTAPAAVSAAIARAYYHESPDKLSTFGEVLKTGSSDGVHAAITILKLRDRILRNEFGGGARPTVSLYRLAQNAVYQFCQGIAVKALHEAHEDLYPLPPPDSITIDTTEPNVLVVNNTESRRRKGVTS